MRNLGRVHWLLIHLPYHFKNNYDFKYDYAYHRYCFWRHRGFKLLDCFIVLRTSKKCFRVMYFNNKFNVIRYFSAKKSIDTAEIMYNYFLEFKDSS